MFAQYVMFAKPMERRILAHAVESGAPVAETNMIPVAAFMDMRDIRAVLGGDRDAYARIVTRYQAEVGRYMWRFTRDVATRDELVHDVFVEAYLGLGNFRGDAPLAHWLRKIATRVGYHFWRHRARERERRDALAETPLPLGGETADLSEPECSDQLHRLLSQLPPRDRLVLTLLYLEECSVSEAAEATGWSRTMVKVQAYRARGKFRRILEEHNWRSFSE